MGVAIPAPGNPDPVADLVADAVDPAAAKATELLKMRVLTKVKALKAVFIALFK